ncbi:hypothetical protein [Streptomyces phaeochromogenes]
MAVEPDLIADHPVIVSAARCSLLPGGLSWCLARHAEVDRHAAGGGVELVDFGFGPGEADAETFDLAEPALLFGLGDPVQQVVADLYKPAALGWVGTQE